MTKVSVLAELIDSEEARLGLSPPASGSTAARIAQVIEALGGASEPVAGELDRLRRENVELKKHIVSLVQLLERRQVAGGAPHRQP